MLPERESRPGWASQAAQGVTDGDLHTISQHADNLEHRRRVRLKRDLHKLADRLAPYDLPAAALARAWAREVAA